MELWEKYEEKQWEHKHIEIVAAAAEAEAEAGMLSLKRAHHSMSEREKKAVPLL